MYVIGTQVLELGFLYFVLSFGRATRRGAIVFILGIGPCLRGFLSAPAVFDLSVEQLRAGLRRNSNKISL